MQVRILLFALIFCVLLMSSCDTNDRLQSVETHEDVISQNNPKEADKLDEDSNSHLPQVDIPTNTKDNDVIEADSDVILENMGVITSEPRKAGTEGELRALQFIDAKMKSYGYSTDIQSFNWYKTSLTLTMGNSYDSYFDMNPYDTEALGNSNNLIAEKLSKSGSDKFLIISAHYDTEQNNNGIIDNATGTCALLEIARVLYNIETDINIRFIFFGNEEYYFSGSRHYLLNLPIIEKSKIIGNINIDMIGNRDTGDLLFCTPSGTDNILTLAFRNHFTDENISLSSINSSDDFSFTMDNIPAIMVTQSEFAFYKDIDRDQSLDMDIENIKYVCELIAGFITEYEEGINKIFLNRDRNEAFVFDGDILVARDGMNINKSKLEGYYLIDKYAAISPDGLYSTIVYQYGNDNDDIYTISVYPTIFQRNKLDLGEIFAIKNDPFKFYAKYLSVESDQIRMDIIGGFYIYRINGNLDQASVEKVYRQMTTG